MKKLRIIISMLVLLGCIVFGVLFTLDKYYTSKIQGRYYNAMDKELIYQKFKGLELQDESFKRSDVINVYGSSELNTKSVDTHPSNFFKEHYGGFDVNLIGTGYCQSIIHAINLGALNDNVKDKKIVIIISPQWFSKDGLTPEQFNMNFSELQFYELLNNKNLDSSVKNYVANRVNYLTSKDSSYFNMHIYAYLNSKNNIFTKIILTVMEPYYKFQHYLLTIRDKSKTYEILEKYKTYPSSKKDITPINWSDEQDKANETGKAKANNNEFYIKNDVYNSNIKNNIQSYKDYYKGQSYSQSPEYEDLKVLLSICKQRGIKPLFVSVPANGRWYDYGGFTKDERKTYYDKVKNLIDSYGYDVADFTTNEYEPYFLQDTMHLGWKGWLNVDKAIDEYYNKN